MPARLLILLLAATTGACALGGGIPRPFPGAALPPPGTGEAEDPPAATGEAPVGTADLPGGLADGPLPAPDELPAPTTWTVVQTALGLLGVPYRNGGSDPSGFDCSGLVQWVFARHGTALPREVRDQFLVGRRIDLRRLQPGDLIFFETIARGASHVGIVIGESRFVHAPNSGGAVRVEPYTADYWIRRFVGARRIANLDAGEVEASARPRFPGSVRSSR